MHSLNTCAKAVLTSKTSLQFPFIHLHILTKHAPKHMPRAAHTRLQCSCPYRQPEGLATLKVLEGVGQFDAGLASHRQRLGGDVLHTAASGCQGDGAFVNLDRVVLLRHQEASIQQNGVRLGLDLSLPTDQSRKQL